MLCCALGLWAGSALGNDRLPPRVREHYGRGRAESEKYLRYLLEKVWGERVSKLAASGVGPSERAARADAMVDEIVHLALPSALRYTRAAIFGTRGTHLTIVAPELGRAAPPGKAGPPAKSAQEAIAQLGGAAERAVEDRLEQALAEDLGDMAQQWVEGAAGLSVQGRSRARVRPLPTQWEKPYQDLARGAAQEYTYWWLRKRDRKSVV